MNQKPLVLVVDDDPGLVRLITVNLELEGYRVTTANNGRTALQLIKDEKPTLVLLDIMLPNMDGFQVCERIRELSDVPIIMITAKGGAEDVVHGLDIGADDYVGSSINISGCQIDHDEPAALFVHDAGQL